MTDTGTGALSTPMGGTRERETGTETKGGGDQTGTATTLLPAIQTTPRASIQKVIMLPHWRGAMATTVGVVEEEEGGGGGTGDTLLQEDKGLTNVSPFIYR